MVSAHPNHQLRSLSQRKTKSQLSRRKSRIDARSTVAENLTRNAQAQNALIHAMHSQFHGRGIFGRLKFLFFRK